MNHSTHSCNIRGRIALAMPGYVAASEALVSSHRYPHLYKVHLFLVHSLVRASVPLMECALQHVRDDIDPLSDKLAAYFTTHIPEESGHDEWVLQDLQVLGVSQETVNTRMPPAAIAAAVGAQYYWIRHFDPIALLGYIAVLEGYPPNEAQLREIIRRTGLPEPAFRSFLKHARLDEQHRDDLDRFLDSLPLTAEHYAIIGTSALTTLQHLTAAIQDLADSAQP